MIVAKNSSATAPQTEGLLLEKQLEGELIRLDRAIMELQQERQTVLRLWQQVRSRNVSRNDVTRRNSAKRVLVEHSITEALSGKPDGLDGQTLFRSARDSVPDLKPVTFRTHLYRMKQKGLITPNPHRPRCWVLRPGL
jgi:hypothetical protein